MNNITTNATTTNQTANTPCAERKKQVLLRIDYLVNNYMDNAELEDLVEELDEIEQMERAVGNTDNSTTNNATNNDTNSTNNYTTKYTTISRQLTLNTLHVRELEDTYQELVNTYEIWATRSCVSTQVLRELRTNLASIKHQLAIRGVRV